MRMVEKEGLELEEKNVALTFFRLENTVWAESWLLRHF